MISKGTTYNSHDMTVLISFRRFSDNPDILPIFELILSIFIQTDNIPFFVCKINENKLLYFLFLTYLVIPKNISNLNYTIRKIYYIFLARYSKN